MNAYDGSDVFKVDWTGDSAVVRHYPDPKTRKVCCKVQVTITEKDRERGLEFEVQKGSVAALLRANMAIDKKHGRQCPDPPVQERPV